MKTFKSFKDTYPSAFCIIICVVCGMGIAWLHTLSYTWDKPAQVDYKKEQDRISKELYEEAHRRAVAEYEPPKKKVLTKKRKSEYIPNIEVELNKEVGGYGEVDKK